MDDPVSQCCRHCGRSGLVPPGFVSDISPIEAFHMQKLEHKMDTPLSEPITPPFYDEESKSNSQYGHRYYGAFVPTEYVCPPSRDDPGLCTKEFGPVSVTKQKLQEPGALH